MRINKFFTEYGFASRREADRWIQEGRVTINGKKAQLGDAVAEEEDTVCLDGRPLRPPHKKKSVILAYHKPRGIVCTLDTRTENNLAEAIDYPERVFHVGRLDQYSEGLLLMTNMGDLVNKILRAEYGHEKEYIVQLDAPISDKDLIRLARGVRILGQETLPCTVEKIRPQQIRMILTEGKNRQIRRMLETVGLKATRLKRIRVMHVELGDLAKGKWRKLNPKEMRPFLKLIEKAESA